MNLPKQIKNPMWIMLMVMGFIILNIVAFHLIKIYIQNKSLHERGHAPITVSSATAKYENWDQKIYTLGSLRAVQGLIVTTQVDGQIEEIYFNSNQEVKEGDPLVQLEAHDDIAALHALEASAKSATLTYERDKVQNEFNAVSKEVLDTDQYTMLSLNAQVEQQAALVAKKLIRAPFAGKLGFTTLNKGEFLSAGDPIVSLQNLDDLYVDFYTPEQNISKISLNQTVRLSSDAYPKKIFVGKLTAIDPLVDVDTRNIKVEAKIANPKRKLLPGMYVRVEVITGAPKSFLTIPQAAVSYNPYGNLVYVINEKKAKEKDTQDEKDEAKENDNDDELQTEENDAELFVKQRFVTLGEKRGDQVQVLKGLKAGEQIVVAGQLKLKNNSPIKINNKIVPSSEAHPNVGIAPGL